MRSDDPIVIAILAVHNASACKEPSPRQRDIDEAGIASPIYEIDVRLRKIETEARHAGLSSYIDDGHAKVAKMYVDGLFDGCYPTARAALAEAHTALDALAVHIAGMPNGRSDDGH